MKCDKCNKKATVHLTEIVDGKVMEMHLCEECAREQSQHMEQQFGLADLLAGLTDFGKHIPNPTAAAPKNVLLCPACGLSYDDFRKFGRFGCAQCYLAFKEPLKGLLKKIHGSNVHLGKKPAVIMPLEEASFPPIAPDAVETPSAKAAPKPKPAEPEFPSGPASFLSEPEPESVAGGVETLETLRQKMQQAVEQEDFELAAELRDKIRAMEEGA